jgi:hypothetical protein
MDVKGFILHLFAYGKVGHLKVKVLSWSLPGGTEKIMKIVAFASDSTQDLVILNIILFSCNWLGLQINCLKTHTLVI